MNNQRFNTKKAGNLSDIRGRMWGNDNMKTLSLLHERIQELESRFQDLISQAKETQDPSDQFLELEDVNRAYAEALGGIISDFGPAPLAMGILSEMASELHQNPLEIWVESSQDNDAKTIARTVYELSIIKERLSCHLQNEHR